MKVLGKSKEFYMEIENEIEELEDKCECGFYHRNNTFVGQTSEKFDDELIKDLEKNYDITEELKKPKNTPGEFWYCELIYEYVLTKNNKKK